MDQNIYDRLFLGLFKIINKNKKIFERLVLINATVNNIEKMI